MGNNENAEPETDIHDCGPANGRDPGCSGISSECSRPLQRSVTGRLSISKPEPYRERENVKPIAKDHWLFDPDIQIDYQALEDTYLEAYSQADILRTEAIFEALGSLHVPGDDERDDEVS